MSGAEGNRARPGHMATAQHGAKLHPGAKLAPHSSASGLNFGPRAVGGPSGRAMQPCRVFFDGVAGQEKNGTPEGRQRCRFRERLSNEALLTRSLWEL